MQRQAYKPSLCFFSFFTPPFSSVPAHCLSFFLVNTIYIPRKSLLKLFILHDCKTELKITISLITADQYDDADEFIIRLDPFCFYTGYFFINPEYNSTIKFIRDIYLVAFAGSTQYVAVTFLTSAFNPIYALLMTLMINARHLFYGISMLDKYKYAGKFKPYLIFGLCDETLGLDFVLTALFVVIFARQWKAQKDHRPAIIGILCSVVCLVVFGPSNFVIPSMIAILAVLTILQKKDMENKKLSEEAA